MFRNFLPTRLMHDAMHGSDQDVKQLDIAWALFRRPAMHAATRSTPAEVGSLRTDVGESPSKASYVLHLIRTDILSAVFKPGQKLAFNLLTAKYHVGLSP